MVKVNRKFVALLLMSIMLVSMVAFSASAFEGKAATTGGNLNIWVEKTLKGAKIATVKNGTNLGEIQDLGKGVGYAVKYDGYVRLSYVAKVTAAPAPKDPTIAWTGMGKANTTGGNLNLWEKANFTGTKIATVPNGTIFPSVTAYKEGYAVVTTSTGKTGYVRTSYLVSYKAPEVKDPTLAWEGMGKAATTGGNLNLWEKPNFTGKKIQTVANGTIFPSVIAYKEGYAIVTTKEGKTGYVRTRYLQAYKPVTPDPVEWTYVGDIKVTGTAPDSVIYIWKDMTKEGGSKKAAYQKVPVGTKFTNAWKTNDGWTEVWFEVEEGKWDVGYIMTKYAQPFVPVEPDPIEWTPVGDVKVVGTAPNSEIHLWKTWSKEGGSKKESYGTVALGTVFEDAWKMSNGFTEVNIGTVEEPVWAYIDSKYVQVQ